MSDRFVILSGCSGGGKSTLLEELRARGHATVAEPGRRIVREEMTLGGNALPWIDPEAFARRALQGERSFQDLDCLWMHLAPPPPGRLRCAPTTFGCPW